MKSFLKTGFSVANPTNKSRTGEGFAPSFLFNHYSDTASVWLQKGTGSNIPS
jgi:hypothetical protein